MFMYGLWIRKPLNIQSATVIDFKENVDLIAWLLQRSLAPDSWSRRWGGHRLISSDLSHYDDHDTAASQTSRQSDVFWRRCYERNHSLKGGIDRVEPSFVWFANRSGMPEHIEATRAEDMSTLFLTAGRKRYPLKDLKEIEALNYINENGIRVKTQISFRLNGTDNTTHYYPVHSSLTGYIPELEPVVCRLLPGQILASNIGLANHDSLAPDHISPRSISLPQKDIKRLELVSRFLTRIGHTASESRSALPANDLADHSLYMSRLDTFEDKKGGYCVLHRAENILGELPEGSGVNYCLILVFAFIPAMYGVVHLGALSIEFASSTEKLFWRVSCSISLQQRGPGEFWRSLSICMTKRQRQVISITISKGLLVITSMSWGSGF